MEEPNSRPRMTSRLVETTHWRVKKVMLEMELRTCTTTRLTCVSSTVRWNTASRCARC
jgi:hypothetical protein